MVGGWFFFLTDEDSLIYVLRQTNKVCIFLCHGGVVFSDLMRTSGINCSFSMKCIKRQTIGKFITIFRFGYKSPTPRPLGSF